MLYVSVVTSTKGIHKVDAYLDWTQMMQFYLEFTPETKTVNYSSPIHVNT